MRFLHHLAAVGRGKPTAKLDFVPGLNVIYGAANTGKTHVLHLIDFALGASAPPEAPPEQRGYEGILLGVEALDGRVWTLCRSLQGGDIRRLDGLHDTWPGEGTGEVLAATHRAANSLSRFLLDLIGMSGVRLRRNAKGDLQDLSFRNIAHLVIVPEGKIQSEVSPVETGQYVSKTVEFSVFKYMLTGIDDSSLQVADRSQRNRVRIAAQLELLDAQIAEAEQAVKTVEEEREELGERHQRLEETVNAALQAWGEASVDYRTLASKRRTLRERRDQFLDRQDEIDLLLARFALLSKHYNSDLSRLRPSKKRHPFSGRWMKARARGAVPMRAIVANMRQVCAKEIPTRSEKRPARSRTRSVSKWVSWARSSNNLPRNAPNSLNGYPRSITRSHRSRTKSARNCRIFVKLGRRLQR